MAARPWVEKARAAYPTWVDAKNALGEAFGYTAIPVGIMVRPGGTVAGVKVPFSVDDESDRRAVEVFARGGVPEIETSSRLDGLPAAIESFAGGVSAYGGGDKQGAIRRWREALAEDPANHLIRKQIWAVQNPDRFYPEIDWDWQMQVLAQERKAEASGSGRK